MTHGVLVLLVLAGAGLLPACALVEDGPTVLFSSVLCGALLAAFAALGELAVGSTITTWFVAGAAVANVAAAAVLWHRRRAGGAPHTTAGARADGHAGWVWAAAVTLAGTCAWSLTALRAHLVGYDTHAIWVLHAMFAYGGHGQFLADLRRPAYGFSNPDYPPLASAAGALGFVVAGHVDYRQYVVLLAGLNAAAIALLGAGVARLARDLTSATARAAAVVVTAALSLVAFAIAGQYAVDGYADLLWSAAAVAAVVYGLVLPRRPSNLRVAWMAATVAALTKNEGLTAAVVVLALVAVRYVPAADAPAGRHLPAGTASAAALARTWVRRGALALALVLPGALWAIVVKLEGVGNTFFGGPAAGTPGARLTTTVPRLWAYLHVLPLALAVALAGAVVVGEARRAAGVANAGWLWATFFLWMASLVGTYTLGQLPVTWWLRTSADRTTIFPQMLLFAEMGIWAIMAVERRRPRAAATEQA